MNKYLTITLNYSVTQPLYNPSALLNVTNSFSWQRGNTVLDCNCSDSKLITNLLS